MITLVEKIENTGKLIFCIMFGVLFPLRTTTMMRCGSHVERFSPRLNVRLLTAMDTLNRSSRRLEDTQHGYIREEKWAVVYRDR